MPLLPSRGPATSDGTRRGSSLQFANLPGGPVHRRTGPILRRFSVTRHEQTPIMGLPRHPGTPAQATGTAGFAYRFF